MERTLELENPRFAAIIAKTDSGKNYHWVLNIEGNFDDEQVTCMVLKCFPKECLLVARWKIVTLDRVGKLDSTLTE